MAKTKTKRVHHLAKEIGVPSKDIVARCNAEGVPNIENHMSVVSVGLEFSIRGWFAESGESDAAVDSGDDSGDDSAASSPRRKAADADPTKQKAVKKAAARKKPRAKAAEEKEAPRRPVRKPVTSTEEAAPEETARPRRPIVTVRARTEDGTAPRESDLRPRQTDGRPHEVIIGPPTGDIKDSEQAIAEARAQQEAAQTGGEAETADTTEAGSTPAPSTRQAVPNVPVRPENVEAAGPRLSDMQQKPAKVSGPKVVRVEEAEDVSTPKPRGPRAPGGPGRGRPMQGGMGAGGPMPEPGADPGSRRNVRRKSGAPRTDHSNAPAGRSGSAQAGGRRRDWGAQDLREREQRLAGAHGFIKTIKRDAAKRPGGEKAKTAREVGGSVRIEAPFTIKDLSSATGIRGGDILKAMMSRGVMTTINSGIDPELAIEIMMEHNIELDVVARQSAQDIVESQFQDRQQVDVRPRPPVVTIMGHVDHGKTSLLDRIRKANVAAGEAGGITQHTSAFRVDVRAGDDENKKIVFLDTPGHEAFTAMRARGAKVTDIVVLVVAADDGVMPQTIESINHAKAAGVGLIVALNKIDRPEATEENIRKIFGQLAEHELSPVEWGGKTELVRVSAVTGDGVQDLLDAIDFQSQLMELTADYGGPARGAVIEARMVEGRGPVANVLVQDGRVKIGDVVVMGRAFGRVRDMTDDRGKKIEEAGPATPLEISGLSELPDAGDSFFVVESLRIAEQAAEQRRSIERERQLAAPKVTLDNVFTQIKSAGRRDLNLIVKADVAGSVETLRKTLEEISTDEVNIRVLHAAVGGINDSDVTLAEASGAIILGFHVIASAKAREQAEQRDVEIRTYQVIYELLDDVRRAASGLLEPEKREEVLGHAEVRDVFKISKVGMIAGCYVTDGSIERNARVRITRQDIVVENDRLLEQLKRFKDDVREVKAGQECGMKVNGYDDIKPGDVIECYRVVEVKRTL